MRRTFVKTLVGAAVVAAFAGIAYAQQGKPIKIGLLATLEGPFAAGGQDGMRGAEMAIRERPDLAILDVKMPKLTGLQATREIKRQAPEVSVLILSMHDDERYLFEALKAGASGYVGADASIGELAAAIRGVVAGELVCPPHIAHALFRRMRDEAPLYYNDKYGFYALSRYHDVKNAFIDCDARRSRSGIELISPVIFCSAEARASGFIVR